MGNLTGWHFLIILLVILLLFGAPKLPQLAKSIGQSMKILKNEVDDMHTNSKTDSAPDSTSSSGKNQADNSGLQQTQNGVDVQDGNKQNN